MAATRTGRAPRALVSVMARLRCACLRFTSLDQRPMCPPKHSKRGRLQASTCVASFAQPIRIRSPFVMARNRAHNE